MPRLRCSACFSFHSLGLLGSLFPESCSTGSSTSAHLILAPGQRLFFSPFLSTQPLRRRFFAMGLSRSPSSGSLGGWFSPTRFQLASLWLVYSSILRGRNCI